MSKAGRKKGSKNILNKEISKDLSQFFRERFKAELKNFHSYSPETRINILLKTLPYILPKGNISFQESEVQSIVFNALLPHYKKLDHYMVHIPPEKKPQYLLRLLKQMHPVSHDPHLFNCWPIFISQVIPSHLRS